MDYISLKTDKSIDVCRSKFNCHNDLKITVYEWRPISGWSNVLKKDIEVDCFHFKMDVSISLNFTVFDLP